MNIRTQTYSIQDNDKKHAKKVDPENEKKKEKETELETDQEKDSKADDDIASSNEEKGNVGSVTLVHTTCRQVMWQYVCVHVYIYIYIYII